MSDDSGKKREISTEEEVTEVGPLEDTTAAEEQPPVKEKPKAEKKEKARAKTKGHAEQIKALEEERDEFKDKFLRTYADLENFRKRVARDKEELLKFGNEKLLREVLHIKDDLERAVEHQDSSDLDTLKEGLALIGRDLDKLLAKFNVEEVKVVGKPFDPQFHEAMAEAESEQEPGTVTSVYQKGYLYHGRLLRPARVVVAKAKPKGPSSSDPKDSSS